MSRIHEALKKAQQERAAGAAPDAPALPAEPQDSRVAGLQEIVPAAPEASEPLTLAALATRCARPQWNPEATIAQLYTSLNHVPGGEELRTLRSRLYQIRDRQPLKTLLITSALPTEGKTFITAGLAQTIVRQHERRALMIDADLRKSQLHNVMGAPASPGLTEYLSGQADEVSIIQAGPKDNLFLIPGGKPAEQPSELLANGRIQVLLQKVAPLFDWVLLDSPPVIPVSDASLLAKFCDGVLLVVRAESTPFDMAQKVRDEFRDKNLLGVVLNQVARQSGYGYYYYYSEGAKGGSKKR
jgi:capsular exopolysaccharide synthesis family protein